MWGTTLKKLPISIEQIPLGKWILLNAPSSSVSTIDHLITGEQRPHLAPDWGIFTKFWTSFPLVFVIFLYCTGLIFPKLLIMKKHRSQFLGKINLWINYTWAYLIFVTNITNLMCGEKMSCGEISDFFAWLMWKIWNFSTWHFFPHTSN